MLISNRRVLRVSGSVKVKGMVEQLGAVCAGLGYANSEGARLGGLKGKDASGVPEGNTGD